MLNIRLSRVGKKKQPTFRVIVTEKGRDPWGKAREILGSYDPRTKKLQVEAERIKHWLSVGATVTDSVWNILLANKLVEGKTRNVVAKTKSNPPKKEEPKEEKKEEAAASAA
jgi:small subunit ribosomal protein S16